MSLLDELHSLDLSGIVQARGSITASIGSPQLQSLLKAGASQSALGSLGASLGSLRGSVQDPSELLKPVVDAVGGLAGNLKIDQLPLPKLLEAVGEGVTIVVKLIEGLDRDPAAFTKLLGFDLQQAFGSVTPVIGSYTSVGDVGSVRAMADRVDQGLPGDSRGIAEFALDALLPFPRNALQEVRTELDVLLDGSTRIDLPASRNAGLLVALDAVAAAGTARNAAALDGALSDLSRARANTIEVLHNDVLSFLEQVGRLHIEHVLDPVARAGSALSRAEDGVLEFLDKWRSQFAHARNLVDTMDPTQIRAFFNMMVQLIEDEAHKRIVAPIDAQVQRMEEFVRGLLSHLPIRSLRAQISAFLHAIAEAIRNAGIDAVAKKIHDLLGTVKTSLDPAHLTEDVTKAIQAAKQVITQALDPIIKALKTIGDAIKAVTDKAKQILDKAVEAISSFADAIKQVTAAIDGLGVEQASQQIVDTLHKLRETAEKLLSSAPLPEPLRPVVEQLIHTLEGLDFDVVFKPVHEAVAQIQVPPEISAKVTDALQKVKDILDHLIPAQLIASIEAEIKDALDEIRKFNPAKLLEGVTGYLNEAARFIDGLDPTGAISHIRGPFQAVLDAVDSVQPRKLLKPVIDGYNSVIGNIHIPGPDVAIQGLTSLFNSVGESVASAALSPLTHLSPEGSAQVSTPPGGGAGASSQPSTGGQPGSSASTPDSAPAGPPAGGVRPGDIIRLFGYVPKRLREVLQALEAGPTGEVIHLIDSLTGGLARDLRRLQAVLRDVEKRLDQGLAQQLLPVGAAQVRAQLAVRAGFGEASAQARGSLDALASVSPSAMQQALAPSIDAVRQRVRNLSHSAAGNADASIERIAFALENCQLARIATSLDAFLAALDPEPLAAELDAIVVAVLKKAPTLLKEIEDDIGTVATKLQGLIRELNPGNQAQKFLRVLDILREEFEVLNPARLADELGEIHSVIRGMVAAYDPAVFAEEIKAVLQEISQALHALDPSKLLGDLSFLNDIVNKIEQAIPTQALAAVGADLTELGNKLVEADPAGLLQAINNLGPRIVDAFQTAVEGIKKEVLALLESIKFAAANASASVSVSAGAGIGQ